MKRVNKKLNDASGWPFAGTLVQSQRAWTSLAARTRSSALGGNLARSSSQRPAQDQPKSSTIYFQISANNSRTQRVSEGGASPSLAVFRERWGYLRTGSACLTLYLFALIILNCGFIQNQDAWQKVNSGIWDNEINVVQTSRSNPSQVYFASPKNFYRLNNNVVDLRVSLDLMTSGKKVNSLYIDPANPGALYIATDNGLYIEKEGRGQWERVFFSADKEAKQCLSVTVDKDKVYLGTAEGLFIGDLSNNQWEKAKGPLSDSAVHFLVEDKTFLYPATGEDVYRLNKENQELSKIFSVRQVSAEKLELEEPPQENGNGTYAIQIKDLEILNENEPLLFLATVQGIFYSTDQGKGWQKVNTDGLPVDEVTSITVRQQEIQPQGGCPLALADKCLSLFAGTYNGVFKFCDGTWSALYKGLESNKISDLAYTQDGNIYCATDKGIFFMTSEKTLSLDPAVLWADVDYNSLKKSFGQEPDIKEVHDLAIRYADVSHKKIDGWKRAARYKAILPTVSVGLDRSATDYYHWDTGPNPDVFTKGRDLLEWDVSVSWDFGDWIWNSDQTSIDSRSKLMVELREDILDQITRLYFERRRIQMELLAVADHLAPDLIVDRQMRIEELTALLDGFTGGEFSELIEIRKRSQKQEARGRSQEVRGQRQETIKK
ncbi:MAG: hypothetical protein A2Z88_01030 [Omnitrophica WOR_2 bacterium GWA2_47_8]|nr:MAG: hypothetical protein A2Z88_01030 [Omnitrophica WOR_2 bacterium GWA2_47_8]